MKQSNSWGDIVKCEKCGYVNSKYDIICEKCGSPLNIEKNIELQKKYNHKPKAIDIEEVLPDNEKARFDAAKNKVKYILVFLLGILFSILVYILVNVSLNIKDSDILNKYDKLLSSELGVIYLGNDSSIDKKISELTKDYEVEYLHIKTNKITSTKRRKLKDKLKLEKIDSTVVIVSKGDVKKVENNVNSTESAINFLQDNDVVQKDLEKNKEVIENYENALNSQEAIIMYIANNHNSLNEKHNSNLKEFCNDYSINYVYIEGYYLTSNQKLKLFRRLNYSEVHNELLIILDEGNIKNVSEDVSDYKKDYFDLANSYGIIDKSSADSLKQIDFNHMNELLKSDSKSVIFFSEEECMYCDRLRPIIGKIGIQNNFDIYYYEIEETNKLKVEDLLKGIGYNEEKITTPLVVVVEKQNILDYIIGLSDKTLYEEKFRELGVMR